MTTFRNGAYIPGTNQSYTTSTSMAANSNPVGATTGIIRVAVNQDTFVAVGNGVTTANANCMLLPAGRVDFFATNESLTQIAFLAVKTAGNITITELQ